MLLCDTRNCAGPGPILAKKRYWCITKDIVYSAGKTCLSSLLVYYKLREDTHDIRARESLTL